MKDKKPTFFYNVFHSITNFDKYKDYALEPVRATLKYLFLMVIIFTLIFGGAIVIKLTRIVPYAIDYIENDVPDLNFKDNILSVNQTEAIELEHQDASAIIITDTRELEESKINEYENKVKLYDNGIVLLKDKVIIKSVATTVLNIAYYKDLANNYNSIEFNKEGIVTFLKSSNMIYAMMLVFLVIFIYLFTIYLITILLDALILAILCRIFAMITRLKMQFRSAFGLAVHALTLPVILNLIYIIITIYTGFTIKYFNWMYKGISYIYIITAIFIIRSDLIKQQMELTKITSEQEKIKMQLEEQKRRETEEQQKEEQKKKEKQKEKEKVKGKGKIDEEPEGSKA